jgi:N,N'-diacetyllegionaminate synthase
MLVRMGVTIGKVPSGEINNVPYLRKMGANFESIILSTGMSTMEEIAFAIDTLQKKGVNKERITVLHCNTEYPTPFEDVNLAAMITIRDTFKVNVGYSDHTIGLEVPLGAITLGAVIIEKHFTLDKSMEGPDHKASLDPLELKNMVTAIRNLELAMGSDQKKPSPSEQKNIAIARRSIVAARPIKRGEIFSEENLTVKRPGTGISPMHWDNVIGQLSDKDYQTDDLISL